MLKRFVLYAVVTAILLSVTSPVLAASPNDKCKVTLNGQSVEWKLEPFLAYAPQGNALIVIPMNDLFTTLGYTVTYDSKLNRSIFTADKSSDYTSFYVDLKTGQVVKESEELKKDAINLAYLINDNLYVISYGFSGLNSISSFLNSAEIKAEYNYIYSKREIFIVQYSDYFSIPSNLSSLEIEISAKYPDHPYVGEQFTKYNTGKYITGAEVKNNFREITLEGLWDGFDNLHFYTGKSEKNELTGKNSTSYAISWELMDAVAEEINKLRKQDGLSELAVDHAICFISVGAKDTKVDSVFDNAVCNLENRTVSHTFCGNTIKAECLSSIFIRGEKDPITNKYNNSTAIIAKNIVKGWFESDKGHKEIIMNKKYKTMGVLVIIGDTGITTSSYSYAVFK